MAALMSHCARGLSKTSWTRVQKGTASPRAGQRRLPLRRHREPSLYVRWYQWRSHCRMMITSLHCVLAHRSHNKHNKRMYQLLLGKKYFSLELNLHSRNAASNSSNSIEHETSSFTLMYYACSLLYFHPFFLVAIAQRQLQSAMADIS